MRLIAGAFAASAIFASLAFANGTGAVAAQPSPPGAAPELRTTFGIVENGEQQESRFWFDLVLIDQRFAFDPRHVPATDAIFDALKDSGTTSRSVSVRFFVDGATFDVGATKPSYIVHDITYDSRSYQVEAAVPSPDPNAVPLDRDVAAAALAKGIALAGDVDSTAALNALARAIDSNALEPKLRALAFKTRSDIEEDGAISMSMPGTERDRLFLAALADARAWQALSPEDEFASVHAARDLAYLGAYDEAIADYRTVMEKSQEWRFRAYVNTAAIYRRLGEYDKALATLDEFVKRDGPQSGMAYHYHRGWILNEAGRYPDAIAEFTAGLRDQPDYQGAFMMRACAKASTGDLKGAIEDQAEAIKGLAVFDARGQVPESTRQDIRRAAEIKQALDAAYQKDPHAKLDAPCHGYSDWGENKRERSALLPPSAAANPAPLQSR